MALRSNSKIVRERVRSWVMETATDYDEKPFKTFRDAAEHIDTEFIGQWYSESRSRANRQEAFTDWTQGGPCGGVFDFWIYYQTDHIELVGNILEDTEQERARFTYDEAARFMVYLIYSEVQKAVRR